MKSLATIYFQKAWELLKKMVAVWLPSNQVCGLYIGFDRTLRILTCLLHTYTHHSTLISQSRVFLSISKIQQIYVCLSATLWYIILPQSKM